VVNNDPLAQLKDIHLPTPISWWPLAPGWYGLAIFILIFSIVLIYYIYQKRKHALPKKQALSLLNDYWSRYYKEHNDALYSSLISELLRRVALVYYPRTLVASMHGEEWLQFLNANAKKIDFNSVKDLLLDAPFKEGQTRDLEPLFATAKVWIKQRRKRCFN
jgi:hypothetical protein